MAFAVCAGATVAVVLTAPELSLAGSWLAFEVVAAALPVAAVLLVRRPAFGSLVVAAMCAWLAAEWSSPEAGPLFAPGLVVYAMWPVLLAAAALRGLDERPLGRAGRALVGLGAAATLGVLGIASAAVFDPRAQGCADCPANPLLVSGSAGAVEALGRAGLALAVAWAAGFCVLAVARIVSASPVRRRLEIGVVAPAAAAIALFGADAAHSLSRGYLSGDPVDRALRVAQAFAFVALAAGIARERVRLRRTRADVARLVLDIGAAPASGELRARLAEALHDPALALRYRVGESWLDEEGREVELDAAGRALTLVRAGGEDVLAVVHRRGLLDDPQLVGELATTARLAVDHERLQAARHARLAELRASRQRIVAAADRERRALERDLHDGAQQRLVTLALSIRLARRTDDDVSLARAEEHVRAAVVELRAVAHGLFPTVLVEEGLGAAIDVLSEHNARLLARSMPDGRFPSAVESAAYFAAHETLRLTERTVSVDARAENGSLRMTIGAEGALGGAITQIQDRVGAAGGTVVTQDGELLLEMPCAS
ncbi:MAG TPA: histidine kinase [Solirubrobacteraceae bacterium]|nr:histidine kinase [Solirubrobacteraceae bacterium]